MVLLIDNYDSFTFNLAHMIEGLGYACTVVRNDAICVAEALQADAIVLSPGPAGPDTAGICIDVIRAASPQVPILGVCLGHQALGAAYGAHIRRCPPMHGRASAIHHQGQGLLNRIPASLQVARYHSLCVAADDLPAVLIADAWDDHGTIMAMHHIEKPQYGVQFHPESVITPMGRDVLKNFFTIAESVRH